MTWQDYGEYSHIEREEMDQIGRLAVFSAIKTFDISKSKNPDAWVSMVIRRKQMNFFNLAQNRSHHRLETDYSEDLRGGTIKTTSPSKERLPGFQEDKIEMDRLTPKQRGIIQLRYLGGYQLKEIGALMGCSKVNVFWHESQALKVLRGAY